MGRTKSQPKEVELNEQDNIDEEENRNRRQCKLLNHNLSIKQIRPLTYNQETAFRSYFEGMNLFMHGSAGTGKTFVALYLALNDLMKGICKKIIIMRNIVSARDVGFLPGVLHEKISVYEQPYREIVKDILDRGDGYDILKKKEYIEFMPTSFLRGINIDDAVIIIDEVQNMNFHEINTIMTRVGQNTKVIICGDSKQSDLENMIKKEKSGFCNLLTICNNMKCFSTIEYHICDIVRSGFVKDFLITKNNLGFD